MSKAQISFEFIMIFSLVFMVLVGFIYTINIKLGEISEQQDYVVMKNLADNIFNEIILASSVNNNYMRVFDIPLKLLGKDYSIAIEENTLVIKILEENITIMDYYFVVPIPIKGTFMEEINENTTDHCITKNNFDGIRISRNQASLDSNVSKIKRGETFDVFFSLNCVQDAVSIRIVASYDPSVLEYIGAEPMVRSIVKYKDSNPLFDAYYLEYDYTGSGPKFTSEGPNYGRLTYGYLAKECSTYNSGNIAKFKFEVEEDAPLGKTYIRFDTLFEEEYNEENIRILDCSTNKFTKEGLPDSKNDAVIEIVN